MIDIDELANQIHADVFDVAKSGIPLGVFPNVFQKIAFELVNYENFNLEYTVAIMLSAFATALAGPVLARLPLSAFSISLSATMTSDCSNKHVRSMMPMPSNRQSRKTEMRRNR